MKSTKIYTRTLAIRNPFAVVSNSMDCRDRTYTMYVNCCATQTRYGYAVDVDDGRSRGALDRTMPRYV